jgi:hypothetical protein
MSVLFLWAAERIMSISGIMDEHESTLNET